MHRLFASLIVLSFAAETSAQTGLDLMEVDLMFVGAHPDDDSSILAP